MSVANSRDSARLCGHLGMMMLTSDFATNHHLSELGDGLTEGQAEAGMAGVSLPPQAQREDQGLTGVQRQAPS